MKQNKLFIILFAIIAIIACEEDTTTTADYVPAINFLILNDTIDVNLIDMDSTAYKFESFQLTTKTDETTPSTLPLDTIKLEQKTHSKYGTYVSADIFGGMLWEDFINFYGTNFSTTLQLKLSDSKTNDLNIYVTKTPPAPRFYLKYKDIDTKEEDIDFAFVIREKTEKITK